eukprot:4383268-Prymnesium_polylepis.1
MVRPDGAHASAMRSTSPHRTLGTTSGPILAPTPGQFNVGSLRICFRVPAFYQPSQPSSSSHLNLAKASTIRLCAFAARH